MVESVAVCSVEGCGRAVHAREACGRHYQQLYKTGTLPSTVVTLLPCLHCGSPMTGRASQRARFCSPRCKEEARTAARRAERLQALRDRKCAHCGEPVPIEKNARTKVCSERCGDAFQNSKRQKERAAKLAAERAVAPRACKQCGDPVPQTRHTQAMYCSDICKQRYQTAYRYDPNRVRAYNREYKYGLTPETFEALLDKQGGVCAVCGTTEWRGRGNDPHVDHCHETGRVRGLLCRGCNNGLGHFGDDPDRLIAAAEYLRRNAPM